MKKIILLVACIFTYSIATIRCDQIMYSFEQVLRSFHKCSKINEGDYYSYRNKSYSLYYTPNTTNLSIQFYNKRYVSISCKTKERQFSYTTDKSYTVYCAEKHIIANKIYDAGGCYFDLFGESDISYYYNLILDKLQ